MEAAQKKTTKKFHMKISLVKMKIKYLIKQRKTKKAKKLKKKPNQKALDRFENN